MATDIELVGTAIAEINKVEAGLAQLRTNYVGMLFDVETSEGMELAKAARLVVRQPRYDVERIRREAKAPLLAIGKKLDAEASRITTELLKIETPIDAQIKAEELRKEAEKAARIAAEAARVSALNARVAGIRISADIPALASSEAIAKLIERLTSTVIDESFEEVQVEAGDAKTAALARLYDSHTNALAREAEALRVKADRKELARMRAEQIARDAAERARLAAEEVEAKKLRDTEAAVQAEALRVQREALAAEQAEANRLAAVIRADQQAEDQRLQAERSRLADEQERLRIAALPKPKPARAKKPTAAEIIKVLAEHYGVSEQIVTGWLRSLELAA